MKLIQVTDLHLLCPGLGLLGIDPKARLEACIEDINRHHEDAALCIFTGDLTDRGEPEAFALLGEVLAKLKLPYRLLLGNHDDRPSFLAAFPEAERDGAGFVQARISLEGRELLLLDTHEPGQGAGTYCAQRCAWLSQALKDCEDRPVYIFMHHPPFDIGVPSMDRIKLSDHKAFSKVVSTACNLKHIFFGHVHRPVSGSWMGIPFSALRSTAHQVPLDMVTVDKVPYSKAAPQYGVIMIDERQTTVHLHDFLTDVPLPPMRERYQAIG
jgi:Icc protein